MSINRREFIVLTAAACAGCHGNAPSTNLPANFHAGPVTNYAADGVYEQFRDEGFFIIRTGPRLTAISSLCTHLHCKLNTSADHSFYCKCHGSTFDPTGAVTEGPAKKHLPTYPTSITPDQHLLVHLPQLS